MSSCRWAATSRRWTFPSEDQDWKQHVRSADSANKRARRHLTVESGHLFFHAQMDICQLRDDLLGRLARELHSAEEPRLLGDGRLKRSGHGVLLKLHRGQEG